MTGAGRGRKGKAVAKKPGAQTIDGVVDKNPAAAGGVKDESAFDRWLEDKLRNAYSSVLDEPIPDDLLRILQQKLRD